MSKCLLPCWFGLKLSEKRKNSRLCPLLSEVDVYVLHCLL